MLIVQSLDTKLLIKPCSMKYKLRTAVVLSTQKPQHKFSHLVVNFRFGTTGIVGLCPICVCVINRFLPTDSVLTTHFIISVFVPYRLSDACPFTAR